MDDYYTPSSSDQMIRNLSMKIGEVDSGSARLLAAHSNLAEPESTSPIFMLKFLIIWSLLDGVKVVDILLVDLLPVELITE